MFIYNVPKLYFRTGLSEDNLLTNPSMVIPIGSHVTLIAAFYDML